MKASRGTRPGTHDGILLVGHGTRDPTGVAEFLETAAEVASRLHPRPVEPCFLELAGPSIRAAVGRLVEHGVGRLRVVPLLLFAAGHAERDIPEAVAAALVDHPEVSACQAAPLGCHRGLVELSALRYEEAIAEAGSEAAASTLLLLVGRGSRDARATAEMHRFAELRAEQTPIGRVETCFFAMAEPLLADSLPKAASLDFQRIVVQPHLLFHGELLAEIHRQVASVAAAHDDRRWSVSRHLGPHPTLSRVVAEIAGSADPDYL